MGRYKGMSSQPSSDWERNSGGSSGQAPWTTTSLNKLILSSCCKRKGNCCVRRRAICSVIELITANCCAREMIQGRSRAALEAKRFRVHSYWNVIRALWRTVDRWRWYSTDSWWVGEISTPQYNNNNIPPTSWKPGRHNIMTLLVLNTQRSRERWLRQQWGNNPPHCCSLI